MRFTVWRDRWQRGCAAKSALLNDNGMCCLGFLGQACGVDVHHHPDPESADQDEKWPKGILVDSESGFRNSAECDRLIHINDEPGLSDLSRESLLTVEFRNIGIDVEFRDGTGKEIAP